MREFVSYWVGLHEECMSWWVGLYEGVHELVGGAV